MSRLKPVFCLLILGLFSAPIATDEDIFKIGVEALNKKDYYFAVACFNDVLQHDAKNVDLYLFRALAYQGRKNWDNAIADFNEVVRLNPKLTNQVNPKLAKAYTNRGDSYFLEKDYKKAVQDHTRAICLDPNNTLAYINRAKTFRQMEKYGQTIEDFTTAIRLSSGDPQRYLDRASTYLLAKNYEKAIQDFKAALRMGLSDPAPYLGLADVYVQMLEYDKAISECSEAIRLFPRNPEAYLKRSEVYTKKGDPHKSMEDSVKAMNLFSESLKSLPALPPGVFPPGDYWWPEPLIK